jgi:hypothetical protein
MKPYRGPPMTLGNAAAAHVRFQVWCKGCGYRAEPDAGEQARSYGCRHGGDRDATLTGRPSLARSGERRRLIAIPSPGRERPGGGGGFGDVLITGELTNGEDLFDVSGIYRCAMPSSARCTQRASCDVVDT